MFREVTKCVLHVKTSDTSYIRNKTDFVYFTWFYLHQIEFFSAAVVIVCYDPIITAFEILQFNLICVTFTFHNSVITLTQSPWSYISGPMV